MLPIYYVHVMYVDIMNTSYTYHFLDPNNFYSFPVLIVLNDVLCFCLKVTIYNNMVLSQGHNLKITVPSQGHNLQQRGTVSRSQSKHHGSVSRSLHQRGSVSRSQSKHHGSFSRSLSTTSRFCLKVTIYNITVLSQGHILQTYGSVSTSQSTQYGYVSMSLSITSLFSRSQSISSRFCLKVTI